MMGGGNESIYPEWRGRYEGLLPEEYEFPEEIAVEPFWDRCLWANWLLHRWLGLGGTEQEFVLFYWDKFRGVDIYRWDSYKQLNFPDVPTSDLLKLAVRLIRRLLGRTSRKVVVYKRRNKGRFTNERLSDADATKPDWVSAVLKSSRGGTLFGIGREYDTKKHGVKVEDTQRYFAQELIKVSDGSLVCFTTITLRQRIISILLDLVEELDPNTPSYDDKRVGFDCVCWCEMADYADGSDCPCVRLTKNCKIKLSQGYSWRKKNGFGIVAAAALRYEFLF